MELNFNEISVIAFIAALVWWKVRQLFREIRLRSATDRSALALAPDHRSFATPLYEGLPVAEHHLGGEAGRCFERIREAEGGLDEDQFRHNGCKVYEAVVTAFASGDRELLRKYLAADVYETFVRSIEDREQQHRHVEFSLVRLKHADIVDARISGEQAAVSIDFESEIVSATLDEAGEVVGGDATHIVTARDRWTFTRGWNSSSQAWLLSTTETFGERRASKLEKDRTREFEEHTGEFRPCM
jgi:predicted lipid-binding transport protein (Tim44 family)